VLRGAVEKGYGNLAALKTDDAYDPLRQREDFRKLLADLEVKAKANAPAATTGPPASGGEKDTHP
jgi:hypothetical protein